MDDTANDQGTRMGRLTISNRFRLPAGGFGRSVLIVAAVLLAGCAADFRGFPGGQAQRADLVDDREVIALMPRTVSRDALLRAADVQGYRLLDTTSLPALGQVMVTFAKPDDVTGAEAIAALEAAEPASTVGINHAYRLQLGAPAADPRTYAQALIEWPAAGCQARGPVGLIDTAVDPGAPNLGGAALISRQFASGQGVSSRHGTEVASLLADPRLLRDVTIYSAGVVGRTRNGGVAAGADDMIRALDWLAGQGVEVVNMSLAGPYNKLLDLAVNEATSRGLILVAAVGNAGPDVAPLYPAAFPSVIAVTAIDADRDVYENAVRGAFVDFAAPGVDVFVRSDETGRFVTGTSIAAPFVTARIVADEALMRTPSAAETRGRLAGASEDLGPRGNDPVFGAGLLKAGGRCG
ncbi:MAG: S8 family serine peptidase [Rhodobacteraceae bacterium]|nr:S8 family serine peptidase [Paracoccaceae bacterium]